VRYVKNTLLLWTLILVSCSSGTKIPDTKFYAEIPFKDCPEAVYISLVSRQKGLVKCEDWKKMRPFMVMIDPEGKKDIFNQWSEACRWSTYKGDQCNVSLKSVQEVIMALDKIAGKVLK